VAHLEVTMAQTRRIIYIELKYLRGNQQDLHHGELMHIDAGNFNALFSRFPAQRIDPHRLGSLIAGSMDQR
jgi:hypothetical protein